MKHRLIVILLTGVLAFSGTPVLGDDRGSQVDRLFLPYAKSGSPGAAVVIVQDGDIIYQAGYGMANLEHDVPITPNTVFHIASLSKQFTAFAILLLEQEGKLSLDDDIRDYLPEVPNFGHTITIRHLIHHTSGLRDQWESLILAGWSLEDVITRKHILNVVRHQKELNFPPGEQYLYCNTGYTLLAEIVSRVSGQSFQNFTQKRLFDPLGMNDTHFHDDVHHVVKNRADSYSKNASGRFDYVPLNYSNAGATSLMTTVRDFAKWDKNYETAQIGGKKLIKEMRQVGTLNSGEKTNYAFGILTGEYKGLAFIEHGGGDAGFRTIWKRFPEQRWSVTVFANHSDFNYAIANQIAEIYLGGEFEEPAEDKKEKKEDPPEAETPPANDVDTAASKGDVPEINPTDYLGDYYSDELKTIYTVTQNQEGRLRLIHFKHGEFDLTHHKANRFQCKFKGLPIEVRFERHENDKINSLLISAGRIKNLRFRKIHLPQ